MLPSSGGISRIAASVGRGFRLSYTRFRDAPIPAISGSLEASAMNSLPLRSWKAWVLLGAGLSFFSTVGLSAWAIGQGRTPAPCARPDTKRALCASRQDAAPVMVPLKKSPWQMWRGVPPARPLGPTAPLASSSLSVGMTDTQVLNLASWGRPARIAREKNGATWNERWIYVDRATGAERRALRFENARLVTLDDVTPTADAAPTAEMHAEVLIR